MPVCSLLKTRSLFTFSGYQLIWINQSRTARKGAISFYLCPPPHRLLFQIFLQSCVESTGFKDMPDFCVALCFRNDFHSICIHEPRRVSPLPSCSLSTQYPSGALTYSTWMHSFPRSDVCLNLTTALRDSPLSPPICSSLPLTVYLKSDYAMPWRGQQVSMPFAPYSWKQKYTTKEMKWYWRTCQN